MLKRTKLAATLALVLLAAVPGCKKTASTSPQVVFTNTLLAGSQSCQLVATGLLAANDTIESLQTSEPDYYAKVKPILQKVAHANDKAIAAVRAAKAGDTSANWQGALGDVAGAIGKEDLTVFGFKNPKSQQLVQGSIAGLQLLLASIGNSFGGK